MGPLFPLYIVEGNALALFLRGVYLMKRVLLYGVETFIGHEVDRAIPPFFVGRSERFDYLWVLINDIGRF